MSFVDLLVELLHGEAPGTLTQERLNQYAKVFDNDTDSVSNKEWTVSLASEYFEEIRDGLLDGNPPLASIVGKPPIIQVNNLAEITGAKRSAGEQAIVIDTFVTTFLWTMNKAWYYGRKLGSGEQGTLFCKLFLHFATLRKFGAGGLVWPRPKTPPHETKQEMAILTFSTKAQEAFLVGHELAHFYVDSGGSIPASAIYALDSPTSYTMLSPRDPMIDQELLSDELGFEYVLKGYQENESIEVVAVTSIFLLIRYHLWLSMVCSTNEREYDFVLWFGRNSLFRNKTREICSDETLSSIVQVSELLEEALEPAALQAKEAFKVFSEATQSVP